LKFRRSACLAFALLVTATFPAYAATSRESVQLRLLRTIQIGAPQDLGVNEIRKIADSSDSDYNSMILARSALLVLHQDTPGLLPYEELLDNVLNHLVPNGNAFLPPPGLPNLRGKETVFTMVYAMVMSGSQERAVDLLEKHMLTGIKYKQAVVLSALRNVGTQRAVALIQKYEEAGQDRNLAEMTLADEDYPALFELHDRWDMVPPQQRGRDNLRAVVQGGCNQRSAMASYWLGFFPPNSDLKKEGAELHAVETILQTNTTSCEMMEHIIALKSLALRSPKTVDYWTHLARQTKNVWERHQIVIDAYGRWGRAFAPAALELLKSDTAQYVQWELMNGNMQTRQDRAYRNYWNIWIPANLLLILEFPEGQQRPGMEQTDLDTLLRWLESGARPKDPVVSNHMLYNLADLVSDRDTRRLLHIFNEHPQRNENWWIIANLNDPGALPLLRYWSTLPAPKDQIDMLKATLSRLESRNRPQPRPAKSCCQPTEVCLAERLMRTAVPQVIIIHSEEEAGEWLRGKAAPDSDFSIRYTDALKRVAVVQRNNGAEEQWEYLYDCWRNTGQKPTSDASQ
jgi:hypothetical protein